MIRPAAFAAAVCLFAALRVESAPPGGLGHVELTPPKGVSTAAFDYRKDVPPAKAKGIVVLVPGYNRDGADMLAEPEWADFARENGFLLGAFTFVSHIDDLREGGGYYATADGSGAVAAAALKKFGAGRIPVFMYGFSGGAHFTASFAENFPQSVRGWCAASFEAKTRRRVKIKQDAKSMPPGIVACGADDDRLGAALAYYGRGREAGRKWTWIEMPGLDHRRSPEIESFARKYFLLLAKNKKSAEVWLDTGSGEDVAHSAATAKTQKTWLPGKELADEWRRLSAIKMVGVIERVTKINLKSYPQLTQYLRLPPSEKPSGVLCLSLLANSPTEVREMIRHDVGSRCSSDLAFADRHNLAVVAWGARNLWDPTRNWDELPRDKAKQVDAEFDLVANAWDNGISYFIKEYGLPSSGYLMKGYSASAQYAQRLALRRPERFLAVHVHIASSFDIPVKGAPAELLWCVTTGENEMGYERSRKFFKAARDVFYPIVYKAYPGLGHEGNDKVEKLGYACFEFALDEYARATRLNDGKPAKPDWADIFSSAPAVADVVNQSLHSKFDYFSVPVEFRMLLPSKAIREAWLDE